MRRMVRERGQENGGSSFSKDVAGHIEVKDLCDIEIQSQEITLRSREERR